VIDMARAQTYKPAVLAATEAVVKEAAKEYLASRPAA